jgi:hypothetical protein
METEQGYNPLETANEMNGSIQFLNLTHIV